MAASCAAPAQLTAARDRPTGGVAAPSEEDVRATLAALEAQTRVTTGGAAREGAERAASAPEAGLLDSLEGLDDESYQALLQQAGA